MFKNIHLSLFDREFQGKQQLNNTLYWTNLLEKDFGIQVKNENNLISPHRLYQYYYDYYAFIKSGLEKLTTLEPQDIRDFLCDKNIGQGKFQIKLLEYMLNMPGHEAACNYRDNLGSTALKVALAKKNRKAFKLIKNKLSDEQYRVLKKNIPRTNNKNVRNTTPEFFQLDKSKKDSYLNKRWRSNQSILHRVSTSGSIEELQGYIDLLGKDIEKLYYRDELDRTPAFYIPINAGSTELLDKILSFSCFSLDNELFMTDKTGCTLFNWIMSYADMEMSHFILNLLAGELSIIEEKRYQYNPQVISSVLDNETALPFYLLLNYFDFDSNSEFMQAFENKKNNLMFTVRLSINDYLTRHEKTSILEIKPI